MSNFISSMDPGTMRIAVVVTALFVFCLGAIAFKLLWKWVMPDLFPGAVSQGLIAGEISYKTAFKAAIALFLLFALIKPTSLFTYTQTNNYGATPPPAA